VIVEKALEAGLDGVDDIFEQCRQITIYEVICVCNGDSNALPSRPPPQSVFRARLP